VAFKLTNEQVAKRAALAIDVRQKAQALNRAVVAFNEMATPLSRAIAQAQDSYNATLEMARVLASDISEAAPRRNRGSGSSGTENPFQPT
jgi:hypothetical protein